MATPPLFTSRHPPTHASSPLQTHYHHHYTTTTSTRKSRSRNPISKKSETQEVIDIDHESQSRKRNHHGFTELITTSQIEAMAYRRGVALKMDRFGPFFNVNALDLQTKEVLGTARGFVRIWINGRILHLDSIRVKRPLPSSLSSSSTTTEKQEQEVKKAERPLFGLTLLLGAAAICYGFAQKCTKAELLAINDSDDMHSKLVRHYTRMGFRSVYHVTGESLRDFPHMLIWGGVGTRMDADIRQLLLKWSPTFQKT